MVRLAEIAEVILKRCQQVDTESRAVLEKLMSRCILWLSFSVN